MAPRNPLSGKPDLKAAAGAPRWPALDARRVTSHTFHFSHIGVQSYLGGEG